MLSLLLIRHGETDWNNAQRIQGQTDIPLNMAGIAQAKTLIPALHNLLSGSSVPTTIFSSPLKRASQTAEIAVNGLASITTDDQLLEINYGRWVGLDGPALEQSFPEECEQWFHQFNREYCPHGGESRADLSRRVAKFHQDVILPHIDDSNKRIILFTHGGLISAYLNVLLQCNARFSTGNASITEFLLKPQAIVHLHQFNVQTDLGFSPYSFVEKGQHR
ncbi:MAG: histidine phosphatase family protein [Anaerolineaceae bacterium]|nr:histidine phosphatase family protein [Anaerolineaceae bacterium]